MRKFATTTLLLLTTISASQADVNGNRWKPQSPFKSPSQFKKGGAFLKRQDAAIQEVKRGGDSDQGKATITASVFNLVNNVAGAGILTLAGGMASGTGWIPAMLICAVLGTLSGHSFAIIGEACELTGEVDFKVCITQRPKSIPSSTVSHVPSNCNRVCGRGQLARTQLTLLTP